MINFSIILPVYNKERFISVTIESVLSQTYNDFELIIVNDGSTDNSISVINKYNDSRIKLFTKQNGGVSAARNYGIGKSSGNIICFIDADDIWDKSYLSELNVIASRYQDIGFFCTAYSVFRDSPTEVNRIVDLRSFYHDDIIVTDYFKSSVLRFGSIALTSSVAVRKSILCTMDHWFEEGVNMGEDVDMWVRIATKTQVVYNNKPLMYYREFSAESLSATCYDYNHSIDYSNWYNLSSNVYVRRFTSQMLYDLAQICSKNKNFKDSNKCLNKIRGNRLILKRTILYVCNIFKIRL